MQCHCGKDVGVFIRYIDENPKIIKLRSTLVVPWILYYCRKFQTTHSIAFCSRTCAESIDGIIEIIKFFVRKDTVVVVAPKCKRNNLLYEWRTADDIFVTVSSCNTMLVDLNGALAIQDIDLYGLLKTYEKNELTKVLNKITLSEISMHISDFL